MELPVNQFKRALKDGKPQIGIWSSLSSHIVAEILAHAAPMRLPRNSRRRDE